jgi:hypothetical protein
MRALFVILAALVLAQCASSDEEDDDRFRVGVSDRSFVIIGVAEAASNTSAEYEMLWRKLDGAGDFARIGGDTAFQAETNEGGALRIRGIPGEFLLREIEPGDYALDSVFAVIEDDRVNYIAQGLVQGPERPSFEVRPGEAVYLGIWQVDIEDSSAVTRLWRMSEADLRAVLREQDDVLGDVRMRDTQTRAVPCTPQRLNNRSQRQVC